MSFLRLFIVHENCKLRMTEDILWTNSCFCFILTFRTILAHNMFCRCCDLLKKIYLYFLRTALTMHGNPSPFWKIAEMSLNPGVFRPNYFFWRAMKVPLYDYPKYMCQALSKCLNKWTKVDKLDYSKSNHNIKKNYFSLGYKNIYYLEKL